MLRQIACACVALAALASTTFGVSAQNRFALVIANSQYKGLSPLTNPARDAVAVTALLKDAGFEVTSALDLDKASMSRAVRFFTSNIAEKPETSVALIYFAGHGVQVDGENFLVPVDATIGREADVPLEAVRLGDLMSMFETVRSKTRIVILDACRDNPFADIEKTAPRGLALVNAPAGTLISYSTSPGHTAEDGTGNNSPFIAALLKSAREPGLPIENALKNVRLAVHGTTGGRQTPWEVSALTEPFSFFPGNTPLKADNNSGKSADTWRRELQALPASQAFAVAVRENDAVVYEQYFALYGSDPLAVSLRPIFERRQMMLAWQEAVALNTEAGYAAFLARYPNSDLSATARRLQQRAQNRSVTAGLLGGANLIRTAAANSCPCTTPTLPANPGFPTSPGSVPPGTRASLPNAPGGPGGPVNAVPSVPGGPVTAVPGGPVIVPGGPVYVPVVPVIPSSPPRITDPGRDRGTHSPGSKTDSSYPKSGDRGVASTSPSDKNSGSTSTKPSSDPKKSSDYPKSDKSGDRGTSSKSGDRGSSKSGDSIRSRQGRGSESRGSRESSRSSERGRSGDRGGRAVSDRGRSGGNKARIGDRGGSRVGSARTAVPRNAGPRVGSGQRFGGGGNFRGGGFRVGGGGGFRGGGFGGRGFRFR